MKFRQKQDALPHPPKDFFDDSFDSGHTSREFGNRPRDATFDLPPPPIFKSPLHQKSPQTFAGSNFTSKPALQTGQLGLLQNASTKEIAGRISGITEPQVDKIGHMSASFDYKETNEKSWSDDGGYSPKDSAYDDDDLYTPVDYKGLSRTSGNVKDKITMWNGDVEDDLYASIDNTVFDRKHSSNNESTKFPKNNTGTNNVHNGPESFPNSEGLSEEDDMPVYAAVDKSSILPKETKGNVDEETEFEIPPPIPDRFFLETEDFQDSSQSNDTTNPELNTQVLTNNVATKNRTNVVPSETGQINGVNKNAKSATIETNVPNFPERPQTFIAKSSGGKGDKNGVVQKLKKGKKKSKSNLSKVNKTKANLY